MVAEQHNFTIADGTSGREEIVLGGPGRFKGAALENITGAPILAAIELGRSGAALRLTDGWVRQASIGGTTGNPLVWFGDLPFDKAERLLVFWDNNTGASVNLTLEWVTE